MVLLPPPLLLFFIFSFHPQKQNRNSVMSTTVPTDARHTVRCEHVVVDAFEVLFILFILRRMGKNKTLAHRIFHVLSHISCVNLTQLYIFAIQTMWRTAAVSFASHGDNSASCSYRRHYKEREHAVDFNSWSTPKPSDDCFRPSLWLNSSDTRGGRTIPTSSEG